MHLTLENVVDAIRGDIKSTAFSWERKLRTLSPENIKDLHHQSDELRKRSNVFTERVAAEIIHFATSPD